MHGVREMRRSARGFAVVELAVGLTLIAIVGAVVLPRHLKTRDRAKEQEVKSNLHTIQIVLERYATDHGGVYPDYILGGDLAGWDEIAGCRAMTLPIAECMRPPRDPLIHSGYIDSYPRNPFIAPGDGARTIVFLTGASFDPGDGDVRFGWSGEMMGNCLDDPRFLFTAPGMANHSRLRWTMCPVPQAYLGVLDTHSPNSFYCMGGLPEWVSAGGGASDPEAGMIKYYWPGEFFYRAGGVFTMDRGMEMESYEQYIWDWPYARIDKYMLGGYGSLRTEGLDAIRLTTKSGHAASVMPSASGGYVHQEYYQDHSSPDREASHPELNTRVVYSNPEVFGGGKRGLMPQFPYYTGVTHEWMFGAPDGFADGVILVLTNW